MSEETHIAGMSEETHNEVRTYEHPYSPAEIKTMVSEALFGKAESWEKEAAVESLKGAANQSMMGALKWGANQLREIAGLVAEIPETETREVDPVADIYLEDGYEFLNPPRPNRINNVSENFEVSGPRKMFDASNGVSEEIDNPYVPLAGGLNEPVETYTVPDFALGDHDRSPESFAASSRFTIEIVEPGSPDDPILLQPDESEELPEDRGEEAPKKRGRPRKVEHAAEPDSASDERKGGDVQ